MTRLVLSVAICLTAAGAATRAAEQGTAISRDAYVSELSRLSAEVARLDEAAPAAASTLLASLPDHWSVTTGGDDIDISAGPLRTALLVWQRHPTADGRRALLAGLQTQRDEALLATEALPEQARERLSQILAAREFSRIRGPSAIQLLRQRVIEWLLDVLARLVGASAVPTITRALITLLVVGAIAVAGAVVYRSSRRSTPEPLRLEPPSGHRPWTSLLAEARASADQRDWRQAIHLVYWTTIAFLESKAVLNGDRSRTPREYLRLVDRTRPERPALEAMTQLFEQAWYAATAADADDYAEALRAFEQLGGSST